MLKRFHVVTIAASIVFCLGYALYQFLLRAGRDAGALAFGVVFLALGVLLAEYLRRFLRRS